MRACRAARWPRQIHRLIGVKRSERVAKTGRGVPVKRRRSQREARPTGARSRSGSSGEASSVSSAADGHPARPGPSRNTGHPAPNLKELFKRRGWNGLQGLLLATRRRLLSMEYLGLLSSFFAVQCRRIQAAVSRIKAKITDSDTQRRSFSLFSGKEDLDKGTEGRTFEELGDQEDVMADANDVGRDGLRAGVLQLVGVSHAPLLLGHVPRVITRLLFLDFWQKNRRRGGFMVGLFDGIWPFR